MLTSKRQRFWTCHWQFRYWWPDINREGLPLRSSGSNNFRKRGVSVGDYVYIVSLGGGQLYLGGRMIVKQIVSRPEAVRLWNNENLYEAEEWIVDPDESGTLLHLHRRLSPTLTKQIRFLSSSGPKEPFFVSETELDNQATRGVRELTPECAAFLDRIIEVTDQLPRTNDLLTVTEGLLGALPSTPATVEFSLPDEIPNGVSYREGSMVRIQVNRYERDTKARDACIQAHGTTCSICGFNFGRIYGPALRATSTSIIFDRYRRLAGSMSWTPLPTFDRSAQTVMPYFISMGVVEVSRRLKTWSRSNKIVA